MPQKLAGTHSVTALGRTNKGVRSVTKIKMMMVRMTIGKEERSENTVLAKMEADTSGTALVNNKMQIIRNLFLTQYSNNNMAEFG